MALSLTTDDLARLETASRALLSPLAAPDATHWLLESGTIVRELLGGDCVVLTAPGTTTGLYSQDTPEIAAACNTYLAAISDTGYKFHDPVVDAWHDMRRSAGLEAFSWDINEQMVEAHGHRITDGPIVADVVMGSGYHDFAGLIKTTPQSDAMVWVLGRTRGGFRFGQESPAVLQALVPAFRAGLDALTRFAAQRRALDAVTEPLAAFDADGRELYRNAALVQTLADEPQRAVVEITLGQLAREMRRFAFARRHEAAGGPPRAEREVATARGRYTLRAALVPAGTFCAADAVLVSVAAALAPQPLRADALQDRFGLTRREAEVAVLLAEGLANDAIADRLFIAPGTARRHTEGIFAKLEVGSRAAAAARLLVSA